MHLRPLPLSCTIAAHILYDLMSAYTVSVPLTRGIVAFCPRPVSWSSSAYWSSPGLGPCQRYKEKQVVVERNRQSWHSSDSGSSKINKLVIFHNKNVTFKMVQVSYRKRRFAEANLAFFLGGGEGGQWVGGFIYANMQRPLSWLSTSGWQMLISRRRSKFFFWRTVDKCVSLCGGEWFGVGMATNAV